MPERDTQRKAHPNAERANATREQILESFDELASKFGGVKTGSWRAAIEAAKTCSVQTFWRHRKALIEEGEIEPMETQDGSEIWQRKPLLSQLSQLSNESPESAVQTESQSTLTTLTIPLGSESCESESRSVKTRAKRKTKNSADSEPYKAD
jgi:hypothetical protein